MSYIGKSPSFGVRQRYYFTATGGETSLSGADDNSKTLIFSDGEYIDVYLNGVLLVAGTDYVTTTTNTISSLAALAASDIVEVVVYDIFSVADTVAASTGGTFQAGITVNGTVTATAFSGDGSGLTGVSAGGGTYKGENGEVNAGGGDIFRVHQKQLDTSVTIDADENALCAGPLTLATGVTVTVTSGGTLVIA